MVELIHPLLDGVVQVAPSESTPIRLRFVLPETVPAGVAEVVVRLQAVGQEDRLTNSLPLGIGPVIASDLPLTAARDGSGRVTVDVAVKPRVETGQAAYLIVDDRQHRSETVPPADSLTFVFDAAPGDHRVRLRVAGMDSPLVDRSVVPPRFDDSQRLVVT